MPTLMCPDCHHRIGNYRANCRTCNRFAAAVRTGIANRLRERFTGDMTGLTNEVSLEVYERQHGTLVKSDET